jgi:hypothetical protein
MRLRFLATSSNLNAVLTSLDPVSPPAVRTAFCPMARVGINRSASVVARVNPWHFMQDKKNRRQAKRCLLPISNSSNVNRGKLIAATTRPGGGDTAATEKAGVKNGSADPQNC